MKTQVSFREEDYDRFVRLLDEPSQETVVIAYAGRHQSPDRLGVLITGGEAVPSDAYLDRGPGTFRLRPAYVAERLLEAASLGRAVVLIHSHPGWDYPPDFSPIDEELHARLVPSALRQIDGPFVSLVRSPGGWNGRIWKSPGEERVIARIRIVGRRLQVQDVPARAQLGDPIYDRQLRAFGPAMQRTLASLRIAIVGLGGTGSLTAQWLAHVGVRDFVLVDPDAIETSNLSRLVGGTPDDVARGMRKVDIAQRTIRSVAPEARVATYALDVLACDAARAVSSADIILNCTDSHASRALVNRIAYQYLAPLIDMATLLRAEDGAVSGAYADVRLAGPTRSCLRCQGVLDADRVREETASPAERAGLIRAGYLSGASVPEPSVLPLNALAVSLALLRLFDTVEPWLEWPGRVTFEARRLQVVEQDRPSQPNCEICTGDQVLGRGDDRSLPCRDA